MARANDWPNKLRGAHTDHSALGAPVATVKLEQRDAICNRRDEMQNEMREGLQPRATSRRLASFFRLLGRVAVKMRPSPAPNTTSARIL